MAEALRKSRGMVSDCLLSMPERQHWREFTEKPKRCPLDHTLEVI